MVKLLNSNPTAITIVGGNTVVVQGEDTKVLVSANSVGVGKITLEEQKTFGDPSLGIRVDPKAEVAFNVTRAGGFRLFIMRSIAISNCSVAGRPYRRNGLARQRWLWTSVQDCV